ncbi:MAG: hypothetical protein DRJ20_02410, partial [Candidatus Methanomethylicota archaeon]
NDLKEEREKILSKKKEQWQQVCSLKDEASKIRSELSAISEKIQELQKELINLKAKRNAILLKIEKERKRKAMIRLAEVAKEKLKRGERLSFEEFKALMEVDKNVMTTL